MADIRWMPEAVGVLEALAAAGLDYIARSIVLETVQRLEDPPYPHRRIRIRQSGSRRLADVQVMLLHPRRLPFKVYYRVQANDEVVEVLTVRHDTAPAGAALPYRVTGRFLSQAELAFYHAATDALAGKAVLCPKVALSHIFDVTGQADRQAHRNRIDRKHVDFLLCEPAAMQPRAGIILSSQASLKNEFVARVFSAAGLPLLRLPAHGAHRLNSPQRENAPRFDHRSEGRPLSTWPAQANTSAGPPAPRRNGPGRRSPARCC